MHSQLRVAEITSYDGMTRSEIARRTGCSLVQLFDEVSSTMDVAHEMATDGCPSGTLIVADTQTSGRGREGKKWQSESGAGVWLTFLSRNSNVEAAHVLSIRIGLALREALDEFASSRLQLKWPNDVFDATGKVAGVLAETRWREGAPEWTAIGIGINLVVPTEDVSPRASALREGLRRCDVLCRVTSHVRSAAQATGALSRDEVQEYMKHDMLRGRKVSSPGTGTVVGISEDGELVISNDNGIETLRSGSVVVVEDR